MSSGKGSAPRPPDYSALAETQGANQLQLLREQTQANRPNQNNPFGSVNWSRDAQGNWTQNTSYDPQIEGLMRSEFGTQQGAQNLAQGFMGQIANQGRFDVSGAPERVTGVGTNQGIQGQYDWSGAPSAPQYDDAARNEQEQAAYNRATQLMGRNFEESNMALENRLANQGITKGSEAYEREMRNAREAQNQQLQNAAYQAVGVGADEAARQYDLGMQGRRQGVYEGIQQGQFANQAQEQAFMQGLNNADLQNQGRDSYIDENYLQYMLPLQMMQGVMGGGGASVPQFESFMGAQQGEATDAVGAADLSFQGNLARYNARNAGSAGMLGGLGSLAGGIAGFF